MQAGQVECLVILGGNPVYSAPADIDFIKVMQKVPFRFHVGLYQDETARQCHWHLPLAHYLESWEDARAFDGTTSLIQPLIEPLYGNISLVEIVRVLSTSIETPGRQIVREYWESQFQQAGSEANRPQTKKTPSKTRRAKYNQEQCERGMGFKEREQYPE